MIDARQLVDGPLDVHVTLLTRQQSALHIFRNDAISKIETRFRVTNAVAHSPRRAAILSEDPFFALRARAYELAGSGRYKRWEQVAYALKGEGFLVALIKRLNADRLAVMMITRSCGFARAAI